jgi:hypothetical protein
MLLSSTEKRRAVRATKLRTTALLAAAGAAFAASAMIGAPTAAADPATIDCQAGQIVIDGQCNVPPMDPNNNAPRNPNNGGTGAVGGGGGGYGAGHGR